MEKHTFGRDWYHYITDNMNRPLKFLLSDFRVGIRQFIYIYSLLSSLGILPRPTKENTNWPLSHVLIDIRDEFLKHENNHGYLKIFETVFNIIIIKYDYDPYFHERIDWVLEKIMAGIKTINWISHAYRLKNDQWWKAEVKQDG